MGFGERYTAKDVAAFFEAVPVEDNKFPAKYCSDMITGKLKDDQWSSYGIFNSEILKLQVKSKRKLRYTKMGGDINGFNVYF